jgi:flagellar motor switch protein FliG
MYEYTTNKEYRQVLREFFNMNTDKETILAEYKDIDEESLDEMMYDETAVEFSLNKVYEKTKDNLAFQKIYLEAAAKMISMNPETGLAILLSYDYLKEFATLLHYYEDNLDSDIENTAEYQNVYSKLTV